MDQVYCIHCMDPMPRGQMVCPHCGFDHRQASVRYDTLRCGTLLRGRYLVGRVLGQGGFGITYIGRDLSLDYKVAIKEYYPMGLASRNQGIANTEVWSQEQGRSAGCDHILKEARKMARLSSIPTVVRVLDIFQEYNTAYIIMEYVQGQTLRDILEERGPMDFGSCMQLLRPLMEDLTRVHDSGVIHRDISPDNIMLRSDGRICLLDLGAAKDLNLQGGQSSQTVQKPGFSPFEQYSSSSRIGPWTDVYALCATIYYCITGHVIPVAFDRLDDERLDYRDLHGTLSQAQRAVLEKGLAFRADSRIQSVRELLEALDGATAERQPVLVPEEGTVLVRHSRSRRLSQQIPDDETDEDRTVAARVPRSSRKLPDPEGTVAASAFQADTLPEDIQQPEPETEPAIPEPPGDRKPRRGRKKRSLVLLALASAAVLVLAMLFAGVRDGTTRKIEDVTYVYREALSGWEVVECSPDAAGEIRVRSRISLRPVVEIRGSSGSTGGAFNNCDGITGLILPDTVTVIGRAAFYGCDGLTRIVLPNGLTVLNESLLAGCTHLERVTLPDSLRGIKERAFYNCSSLTAIELPDGVMTIGKAAFRGCTKLTRIGIPDSVTAIGEEAFLDCGLEFITIKTGTQITGNIGVQIRYR